MELYALDGRVLYQSRQSNIKKTLQQAIADGVDLSGVNLRRARLRGAKLDGLQAPGACLWGADLTGCDLAEADLCKADLRMATLADCCLVHSSCAHARFEGAFFRQVLIEGADFSHCAFSCPSILTQTLHHCASLKGAVYWHRGEDACHLDDGVNSLQVGGHTIVWIGGRLIVNGALQNDVTVSAYNATKSSYFGAINAKCETY